MNITDGIAAAEKSPGLRKIIAVILAFGVFLLCSVWAGLFFKVQSERRIEINNAFRETGNFARAFEEHTLRTINGADQVAIFLKYQYEKEGAAIDIPRYVRAGRFANQPFVLLSVVDEHGDLKASSQEPFVFSNLKDREHFTVHEEYDSGRLFISKPVLGRSSGKWSIQMTRRINKPDGSFGGVIVVSVDPFYFTEFYKQIDLGGNFVIGLVGSDGVVRARQTAEKTDIGFVLKDDLLRNRLAAAGRGHFIATSPIDGVSRIVSHRTLNTYPLTVMVGMEEAEMAARLQARFAAYYQVAALVSAVIVIFIIILMRDAVRQKRTEQALQRARDRLDSEVEKRTGELVAANRELAVLNAEQGVMNDRLQQINRELETEIADRRKAEKELREKEAALELSRDNLSLAARLAHLAPWRFHPEQGLFEFGDEFYAIYGTDTAVEGRFMTPEDYIREFVHPEDAGPVVRVVENAMASPELRFAIQMEHRIFRRDGEERVVAVLIDVERDAAGNILKAYGTNQDVTERVKAAEALKQKTEENLRLAYTDALTGLPNRARLNGRLAEELERARREGAAGAVLFIDLDDLKLVNDTYGHCCGDKIITTAGARIVAAAGDNAFVARVGGDEFVVILPGESDRRRVGAAATRVVTGLGRKHEGEGAPFFLSASIGIAIYPADGGSAEEIINNADNAMYAAKRDGKNQWRFYTAAMRTETSGREEKGESV